MSECRRTPLHLLKNLQLHKQASLVAQMGKNLLASARDASSISGSGRSPGEGNGNPLQHSCLENSMDRGAWWATVQGGRKEWIITEHTHTQLHKHRDCGWMTVLFIKPKAYLCFIPNTWQELGTDFEEFSKGLSNFPKGQTDNYLHRVSAVEKLILVCVCVCVCV